MNAETLERIESKLAFLERANTELSDVVFRQQQELEALKGRVTALKEELNARAPEQGPGTVEDERPPHY